MKCFKFKYLSFFPLIFIIISIFVWQVNTIDIAGFPVIMHMTPVILLYCVFTITYYLLFTRNDQPQYINRAIHLGFLLLILHSFYFLFLTLLDNPRTSRLENTVTFFPLKQFTIFIFVYQFLLVIYATITGFVRALKKK